MKKSILVLLIALMCGGCTKEESETDAPPKPVHYQIVKPVDQFIDRIFSGVTEAGVHTTLSFRVAGTIIDLPVEAGNAVVKDQLLAKLDPIAYQLKVEQAKALLLQQEAKERQATADYERTRDLYETQSSSKAQLDAARALYESAKAVVQAQKKSLEWEKIQLDYTELRAPMDGEIASVSVKKNENITVGQPIVTFDSRKHIDIVVPIPESYISQLKIGQAVDVMFPSLGTDKYHAFITEISVTSKTITTFPVKLRLSKTSAHILSGMSAEVNIVIPKPSKGVWITPTAILNIKNKNYVFVIKDLKEGHGILEKREVETGNLSDEGLNVISGLAPEEYVVTAGVNYAADGMKVKLLHQEKP